MLARDNSEKQRKWIKRGLKLVLSLIFVLFLSVSYSNFFFFLSFNNKPKSHHHHQLAGVLLLIYQDATKQHKVVMLEKKAVSYMPSFYTYNHNTHQEESYVDQSKHWSCHFHHFF